MAKDESKTKKQLIDEIEELRSSMERSPSPEYYPVQDIETLKDLQRLLRDIGSLIQAGLILQSVDGTTLHANKVACELFGMKEVEILGKTSFDPAWEMILEDGTPVTGEEHPSMVTIHTGEPVRDVVRGLFSGDESKTRWLLINTEPVRDPAIGKLEAVLITFVDITRKKTLRNH